MSLRDLNIKKCYESSGDDEELLNSFYLPVLKESITYYRVAGYFTSSSLSLISKSLVSFIDNDGIIKMLISPELTTSDFETLRNTSNSELEELDLIKDFNLDDFEENSNLQLLAWLIKNKRLEIRIVVDIKKGKSIFHQKFGIFGDLNRNRISFSGSINETAQAWLSNIEEFKTFVSWNPESNEYLNNDLDKFKTYWNDNKKEIAKVYKLPEILETEIIKYSPDDIEELDIVKKYRGKKISTIELFPHQLAAIEKWKSNNYQLMISMATGTGKTITALSCIKELMKDKREYLVVISTPQTTLSNQWMKEVQRLGIKYDESLVFDSTNGSKESRQRKLRKILNNLSWKKISRGFIFITHSSACKPDFIEEIKKHSDLNIIYVCDETHRTGSKEYSKSLLEEYKYRIGLSATPDRMFDEDGTHKLKHYFGNDEFEFSISDALKTINPRTNKPFLNPYKYIPIFIELNNDELLEYKKLSTSIMKISEEIKENDDEILKEKLLNYQNKRADIIKNAEGKLPAIKSILLELNTDGKLFDTIIFNSDDQDEQLKNLMEFMYENRISRAKITESESAKLKKGKELSERERIIKGFSNKNFQVLLAMKCLDEGIDIPSAKTAFLMANSLNPREYIQRIGRVIRYSKNKGISEIYDFIVDNVLNSSTEQKIIKKEARRAKFISQNAINAEEVLDIFLAKGVDFNEFE